jgi:hypothetical protein
MINIAKQRMPKGKPAIGVVVGINSARVQQVLSQTTASPSQRPTTELS